ncbi:MULTISPECIES: GNAT family N-acetyltransferase [unclassified Dolichospermum]|uniref:GNAT family N-acetyltransferase n=1 Tax=unclassified Dolichospermum TaxID=2622029 RepID=UPI0014458971|nr:MULTISPECIES: GNAT family protein [unclassified Dolichospermum]MTJ15649.1 GNAT family N-acetyltransferase [Dolichospermum sp. UHCC 0299]MTJ41578.1 GNAT family N-acetyltransferase [Dolichospermum sp. UHCC 0406]
MNIHGEKVILIAIEAEDLKQLQVWANDPEIQYMLGGWHFPTSMNDQQTWYKSLSCNSNNQRFIILNENNVPMGMANLININYKDGNAEHGLLLDKNYRGKGYGYNVVVAIMNYAFNELRLNRLETTIIANNQPSLNLFMNKCRWKKEGVLRNWYFRNGEFVDKIFLGILREEFMDIYGANNHEQP